MELFIMEQQRREAEAALQADAESEQSTRAYYSRTLSTTVAEDFEEIADISGNGPAIQTVRGAPTCSLYPLTRTGGIRSYAQVLPCRE